jgi:hypothetical protein
MPWSETSSMDQRTQFIADYLRGTLSVTELCAMFAISRKTGYKFIERCPLEGTTPSPRAGCCFAARYLGRSGHRTPTARIAFVSAHLREDWL